MNLRSLYILLGFALSCLVIATPGQAGPYHVELTSNPNVLEVGKATLNVFVTDADDKPVSGLSVSGIAQMPGMPMGETTQPASATGSPGHYVFSQSFSMAGAYTAKIEVKGPNGTGVAEIPLETGRATSLSGGKTSDIGPNLAWMVVIALAGIVVAMAWRVRRRFGHSSRIGFAAVLGLTLIVCALVGAYFAVSRYRRPGAMSPLEAQTMDMDMPPPEGTTAVRLAKVELRSIGGSIRYSGQIVGYLEQDVNARTSGVIVSMPVYVGSVVRKGEVLAVLDQSQLGPQVEQQTANMDRARHGVDAANADYRQAQAMVHQAESEQNEFDAAVGEARAELEAANQDLRVAKADSGTAAAGVETAKAQVSSAQADNRYWSAELKREEALFKAGAVSKDEVDKERSLAAQSDANLRTASDEVLAAEAKVSANHAEVKKESALVTAAKRKLDEASSALMTHHAHVQIASAESDAAKARIEQAGAELRNSKAALQGAFNSLGYATLRAESDGIVVDRLISPGTLVSPGQTLLKVDQVQPIRVQANVPLNELKDVRVGEPVKIEAGNGRPAIFARVNSVSPMVDPTSRLGIVEAILPNQDRALAPGGFVTMELDSQPQAAQTTVPTSAIQYGPSGGESIQAGSTASFVWVASPSLRPNEFEVHRQPVDVGRAGDLFTVVLTGVKAGERIVTVGSANLVEGQTVTAIATTAGLKPSDEATPR